MVHISRATDWISLWQPYPSEGSKPPFRWLANGQPFADQRRRRQITWLPDSVGFSTLTVLDAAGRPARIRVFLE
ncbi:MAG TPA: hypothetical protein ENI62_11285 [Gammaproteobacteria bacterium]|nr:hypothetical protein [Gammaproteobacteria bacterium]